MKPEPNFSLPVRVYYEDTDAGGIVYYANYLKFAERARTEWLRQIGFEQNEIRARTGTIIVVKRASIDYKKSALLDDMLHIECQLRDLGKTRMTMQQRVLRGESLLANVEVELVCVDAQALRPAPWPAELEAAFTALTTE